MARAPDPLDDPDYAAFAWGRYRRILLVVAGVAAVAALAAVLWLRADPAADMHALVATGLAVFGSILLTGALMGLIFLSSGSGHDEHVGRGD